MNCTEFQEFLPEVFEGGRTAEQESHLKSCPVCSSLVADLELIAREARQLQEVAEPNPRVWNSIEITLRQEGIIREPNWDHRWCRRVRGAGAWRGWRPCRAVLVAFGIVDLPERTSGLKPVGESDTQAPPTLTNLQTRKERHPLQIITRMNNCWPPWLRGLRPCRRNMLPICRM